MKMEENFPPELVWSAIARVTSDDATYVHEEEPGKVTGISVECTVLAGPYTGATVQAKLAAPIGPGFHAAPVAKGDTLILTLVDGHLGGLVIATGKLPGGYETPMPTAVAGLKTDADGLSKDVVQAPGPGIGHRFYIQGAPFLVRLKGIEEGYAGEFYVELPDGAFIRGVRHPKDGKWALVLRDAGKASVQVHNGKATLQSPNGNEMLMIDDAGVHVSGKLFEILSEVTACRSGSVQLAWTEADGVPNPANGGVVVAKAGGSVAGVAAISTRVVVGGAA